MRIWIFFAISLVSVTEGSSALACRIPARPVVHVSSSASELLARAKRLDDLAAARDAEARAFDKKADTYSRRARILRDRAAVEGTADRAVLLAMADELAARASAQRAQAAEARESASTLRTEARSLRLRARAGPTNPTGGWGRKRAPAPVLPRSASPSIDRRAAAL